MSASFGYEGYSQSLSGALEVGAHHDNYGDSSSSDDDSSWSDWETEHDGQVQTKPPVVKVSDGATRRKGRNMLYRDLEVRGYNTKENRERKREREKKIRRQLSFFSGFCYALWLEPQGHSIGC